MVLLDSSGADILHSTRLYLFKSPSSLSVLSASSAAGCWKETCMIIYSNGVLKWFNDKKCSKVKGTLKVSEIFSSIRVGVDAASKAKKPLPKLLFAERDNPAFFYLSVVKMGRRHENWFCCRSQEDLGKLLKCFAGLKGKADIFDELCSSHSRDADSKPLVLAERYAKYGLSLRGRTHAEYWEEVWRELLATEDSSNLNNSSFDDSVQNSITTLSSFRSSSDPNETDDSMELDSLPSTSYTHSKAERNDTGYSSSGSILEDYQKACGSSFDDSIEEDEDIVVVKENLI